LFDHLALGLNEIALSFDCVPEGIEVLLLQRRHAVSVGLFEVPQERGHALGCGLGWAESNDWSVVTTRFSFGLSFFGFGACLAIVQLSWLPEPCGWDRGDCSCPRNRTR